MASETKTETAVTALANPAPLGLFGFASTTLVLSAANAGFDGVTVGGALTLALFYGGLAQVLVGMWEFRNGNTFGGVAFTGYGMFWLSFWAFFTIGPNTTLLLTGKNNVGWYLLCWTIVTLVLFLGTLRTNLGLIAVFGLLFLAFFALMLGEFSGNKAGEGWTLIGGWLGILTAIAAFYVGAAGVLAAVGGMALPIWPRNK